MGLVLELIHLARVEWLEIDLTPHVLDGKRKAIGNIVCTLLIVVGVGIENWAGSGADDVIRQMRAPRRLSEAQQQEISAKLKPFGPHELMFFRINEVDPEIMGISRDLSKACAIPGWYSGFAPSGTTSPSELLRAPLTGILVVVSPNAPDKTTLPTAKTLVCLLSNDNLEVELSTAFVGPSAPVDNRITIIVYSK
jgi:hypothetical protein